MILQTYLFFGFFFFVYRILWEIIFSHLFGVHFHKSLSSHVLYSSLFSLPIWPLCSCAQCLECFCFHLFLVMLLQQFNCYCYCCCCCCCCYFSSKPTLLFYYNSFGWIRENIILFIDGCNFHSKNKIKKNFNFALYNVIQQTFASKSILLTKIITSFWMD